MKSLLIFLAAALGIFPWLFFCSIIGLMLFGPGWHSVAAETRFSVGSVSVYATLLALIGLRLHQKPMLYAAGAVALIFGINRICGML